MLTDEGIDMRASAADVGCVGESGKSGLRRVNVAQRSDSMRPAVALPFSREALSPDCVVRANEPMSRLTTLRVGGPADWYVEPANEQDIEVVARSCRMRRLPLLVLGRGSNVLVRAAGYRGVVMALHKPVFCRVEVDGTRLRCGAGALLKKVADTACEQSLGGLEFMDGIPGTVGGGLRMNAGAFGSWMSGVLESVRAILPDCVVAEKPASEIQAAYRSCGLLADAIVLAAVFRGTPAAREEIRARTEEYRKKRLATQPREWSAGCIFKNTDRGAAGWLIDKAGLKGLRVGRAAVSSVHANFLVNEGGATASEMIELIDMVREKVQRVWGIRLETEVEIVGEET